MSLFWIVAALLVAATVAVLLWPLLRGPSATQSGTVDADSAAVAVYRDQKRALDADLASGAITPEEYETSLAELSGRVADEVAPGGLSVAAHATSSAGGAFGTPRARAVALAVTVALPLGAYLLYARLGDPGAAIVAASDPTQEFGEQQMKALIESLARRVHQHPNEGESWALLARAYQSLERFPEAVDAFAHADALIPNNADLLADYADALAMTQNRNLAGKPAAMVARALELDPTNKRAIAMAATIAMQAHDTPTALGLWRRLAAQLPAGSDDLREINGVIAQLGGAPVSGAGAVGAPFGPAAAAAMAATPAGATTGPTASGATIAGRVTLSPQIASKAAATDTMFIYARAVDGPRMPLAVLRLPAAQLPKDFVLDDSLAMAGVKLSSAASVIVEARLSKSGNAIPQSGDLFGRSAALKPGASGVNIVIDQVVP